LNEPVQNCKPSPIGQLGPYVRHRVPSIKEVGKSKSVNAVSISAPVMVGEVEPGFDYWMGPLKKLQEQGYTRIDDFQE
jgi:hypothetical protein